MVQRPWISECRRTLVCVDSYDSGVLKGRFFNSYQDVEGFESLSQFLVKIEQLLDDLQQPQSYTSARTFSAILQADDEEDASVSVIRKGNKATFELQILFRQHSSWQGILQWKERNVEQSFRSVLEMVLLMDSALRSLEGSDAS